MSEAELLLGVMGLIGLCSLCAGIMTLTDRVGLARAAHAAAVQQAALREERQRELRQIHAPRPRPVPAHLDGLFRELERERALVRHRGLRVVPLPEIPEDLADVPPIHLYRLATLRQYAAASLEGWWSGADDALWSAVRPVPTDQQPIVMRIEANRAAASGVVLVRRGDRWAAGDVPLAFLDLPWSEEALRARFGG